MCSDALEGYTKQEFTFLLIPRVQLGVTTANDNSKEVVGDDIDSPELGLQSRIQLTRGIRAGKHTKSLYNFNA